MTIEVDSKSNKMILYTYNTQGELIDTIGNSIPQVLQ